MSKWIKYELDNKLVAKPFLSPPIHNGGKGIIWTDDKNIYLGGSFLNYNSKVIPLQPPKHFNSTRIKGFYYN